jgi:hypothetical protein
MKSVSICSIQSTKKFAVKRCLVFFCHLHSPVGVCLIRFQQKSTDVFGLHFHCASFQFARYTIGIFDMFILDGSRVFRKKFKWERRTWSSSDMLHRMAPYDEIRSCTISLKFSAFSWRRKFLQTFYDAYRRLLSVEVDFVLKSWSSNRCLFWEPTKILSFFLVLFILKTFLP